MTYYRKDDSIEMYVRIFSRVNFISNIIALLDRPIYLLVLNAQNDLNPFHAQYYESPNHRMYCKIFWLKNKMKKNHSLNLQFEMQLIHCVDVRPMYSI